MRLRRPVRALDNRGVPIQQNIIDMVVEAVRAKGRSPDHIASRPIQFTLQVPFRSIIWSIKDGKPYTPPAIEYALHRAAKKGLPTTIPIKFYLVTTQGGGGHFQRQSTRGEGRFPSKLTIKVSSWGDAAKSTLTHELTHFAQYVGTALLLFADSPSDTADAYREAFASVDMSRPLYGAPRREARTGLRQARTYGAGRASHEVRTGQHAMLDQEYQTNAQTWADRFLESFQYTEALAALVMVGYQHPEKRIIEPRGLPVLASQLGKYLDSFARIAHIRTNTKRWRRQAELVYQWVGRRLNAPEADMKITDKIREKLHQTPLESKTFQERKALRAAARGKPKPQAERGKWIFGRMIDGKQVDFHEGDHVEFWGTEDGERTLITGTLIEKKRGYEAAKIEQDDSDSVWTIAFSNLNHVKEERSRKAKAERRTERKARLEMRAKRREEMGLTRPPRPVRTPPTPRPSPVAPVPKPAEVKEPIFAYLDRKLMAFRGEVGKGKFDAVTVPLGLSNPQLLSWIYNAAALAGADPAFAAEWPYDRDEPKNATEIRARFRKTPAPSVLDVSRIMLATPSFVGLVTTNLDTRQTALRLSRPYAKRASQEWVDTVLAALREYGLQGFAQ
jgi:hypothetical protein